MSNGELEGRVSPLEEQWPNLRFLGLGSWFAWIWLVYLSTAPLYVVPDAQRLSLLVRMFAISTTALVICLILAAVAWRKSGPLIAKSWFVFTSSAVACVGTLLVASGQMFSEAVFCIGSALTGIGTSVICLRSGQILGRVGLGESLVAGCLSLIFGVMLYFMGIGIPSNWQPFFIALLPVLSAIFFSMEKTDQFDVAVPSESQSQDASSARKMLLRLVVSIAFIGFTAGVGRGVMAAESSPEVFSDMGAVCVFLIALVGALVLVMVNRKGAVYAASKSYTFLMVLGIVLMLAFCFGASIMILSVGEEALWAMFTVYLAFLAFRYNESPVRVFGLGQAMYFTGTFIGWMVGIALASQIDMPTVQMTVGIFMAFLILIVLVYVLPEGEIVRVALMSRTSQNASEAESEPETHLSTAGTSASTMLDASELLENEAENTAPVDHYARAKEEKYGISARELEVMELFAQGRSAAWIAENLMISKNTVRAHLRSVYTKLGVHTRQELLDFLDGK